MHGNGFLGDAVGLGGIMGYPDDRPIWGLLGPVGQEAFRGSRGGGVEGGGGFVEEKEGWGELDGTDEGGDLAFATGEVPRVLLEKVGIASQGVQQVEDSLGIEVARAMGFEGERLAEGSFDGVVLQGGTLLEVDGLTAEERDRIVLERFASPEEFAGVERIE